MRASLVFAVILACLVLCSVTAQRRRNRNRNRNRGPSCHFREIDNCLDKVTKITNSGNATDLIESGPGLNEICSGFNEVVQCIQSFAKRCTTPVQKELFDFFLEYFEKSSEQFCKSGKSRNKFLRHSPCINGKVLKNTQYKSCINGYLAALDKTGTLNNMDDRFDTICCGHNKWAECTNNLIVKECGDDSRDAMRVFVEKLLGGATTILCPRKLFDPKTSSCKKALPSSNTKPKGKSSQNPFSRYISTYFSFLLGGNNRN